MSRNTLLKFHLNALDATELQTLMHEAVSVGRGRKRLPPSVARALDRLAEALGALEHAGAGELAQRRKQARDQQAGSAADQSMDGAVRALYTVLHGWSMFDGDPARREVAKALRGDLFPGGIKFIQRARRAEWAEVGNLLKEIDREGRKEALLQLGLSPFHAHLVAEHRRYGVALGITAPAAESAEPAPPVGAALQGARRAVWDYVRKVRAHEEASDGAPAAAALSRALLRPFDKAPVVSRKSPAPTVAAPPPVAKAA